MVLEPEWLPLKAEPLLADAVKKGEQSFLHEQDRHLVHI